MRSTSRGRLLVIALLLPLTVGPPAVAAPRPDDSSQPTAAARGQLVDDPGFEDLAVEPCFRAGAGADTSRTTDGPLAGDRSLEVTLPTGSTATCAQAWSPARVGTRLVGGLWLGRNDHPVTACLLASVVGSATPLRDCARVSPTSLRKLRLVLPLGGREVRSTSWRVSPTDGSAVVVLDEARLTMTLSPSCDAAPSGPPAAGSCDQNDAAGGSAYEPATLDLRATRPFIPLDAYTEASATDPVAVRFKKYVDRALAGSPDYGYSPTDAVTLYARTGIKKYLTFAIAEVDAKVREAQGSIAHGDAPYIAGDSYLEVGPLIEELALTFDWGHDLLTRTQRDRWLRYGDQAVSNVWSPETATWGNRPAGTFSWSGWSINNPGNNYNFSFLQATELWAVATRHQGWTDFLQERKFPLLDTYYRQIVGGGSREGTGYGTAQGRLWANARTWAEATGEHLTAVEEHARDSVDYWVNATVPTLDLFAPIGDLSRESFPNLYDYQENLVREAAMAGPGTPEAGHALWWIAHNSVPDTMNHSFNLRAALLKPAGTATKSTALTYHATGVGQLFARSSLTTDATWLSVVAGPYDESHAHMEQGSFNLYDEGWLAVTANVWSHSGLQGNSQNDDDLGTGAGSMLRFDTSSGPVPQNNDTSTMTVSTLGDTVLVDADLAPAYTSSEGLVSAWERHLSFSSGHLEVSDTCTVAPSVTPVWQLQVPVRPTLGTAGHVRAGDLLLTFAQAYDVALVNLANLNQDLNSGWRIDLTRDSGCAFDVDLIVDHTGRTNGTTG